MKASSLYTSAYPQTPNQRRPMTAPHFGGVGDLVSSTVGVIDSNRMIELMASDGIGMILPRTALAFRCRGSDDGRETFLREMSGLIGNIFLVGWASYGMTRMLGDHVNPYNPKGIPARAWITAENLDAFGKIYLDELKKTTLETGKGQSPKDYIEKTRENFINRVLEGLESDDREFSIEGRISCLEQLDPDSQGKMLGHMIESVPKKDKLKQKDCEDALKKLTRLKDRLLHPSEKALYTQEREKLRRVFFDAGWGKLSQGAKEKLAQAFALKKSKDNDSSIRGTAPLDEMAQKRAKDKAKEFKTAKNLPENVSAEILKKNGFDEGKEFIKQRLVLSLTDLKHSTKEFVDSVDQKALRSNLTSTVDLKHTLADGKGEEIHISSNRGILLKEMKHFLEQFADRAAYNAGQVKDAASWGEVRKQIEENLVGESHSDNPLRKLVPQADDGLITAAIKGKGAYTWVPMAFCIAAAGAFTFYNNYLTMKKHSGKVFFPGEGMPPIEGAPRTPAQANARPTAPGANGLYHNFGTFPNYPQFRNSQGGIIA